MVSISERLDAHDNQLAHLQSSVSTLQSSVDSIHSDLSVLQQTIASLVKKLDKQPMNTSSGSGSANSGGGPANSGGGPAINTSSAFQFDSSSADASRSEEHSPGNGSSVVVVGCSSGSISPSPSLLVQLEALISRSEERARQLRSVRSKSDNIPASFYTITEKSINTPQSDVFSSVNMRSISYSSGSDRKSESSGGNFVVQLEALIARSEERRMTHQEKHTGDGSSESEFPDSPSLFTRLPAITSRCEANLLGAGDSLPGSDLQSADHVKLGLFVVNWAILDAIQWAVGSNTMEGHDVNQNLVVGLISSKLNFCERGKAPFDRGKNSFSHRTLNGTRGTFSATWHLWVMHGQPRPPEDAYEEASIGVPGHAFNQSLEDKTLSKGGVLLGIIL